VSTVASDASREQCAAKRERGGVSSDAGEPRATRDPRSVGPPDSERRLPPRLAADDDGSKPCADGGRRRPFCTFVATRAANVSVE